MQDNEIDLFTETLSAALGLYDKEVTPMVANIWWESLKKYDLQAVANAFSRYVQDPDQGHFAPKPASIIKIIDGSAEDRALQAWAKFDKAVRSVGSNETVVFDDAVIHKVVQDMGGWISFGVKTEDEWPFIRNEFVKRYRGALASSNNDYPKQLIGIAQASNDRSGRESKPPKLIGDPVKAQQVLAHGGDSVLAVTDQSTFRKIGDIKILKGK